MRNIYYLLLLFFTLPLSFISCSDDDEIVPLALLENEVKMYSNGNWSVTITKGNGGYLVTSSDEKIATASVKDNVIQIKGNKVGRVTITVNDKENKTAKIDVELYEDIFRYEIVEDVSVYNLAGEIDEDVLEKIKKDIPKLYKGKKGELYQFVRSNTYTGDMAVYPTNEPTADTIFFGTFTAANNIVRIMPIEQEEETIVYYGVKYEQKKSDMPAQAFTFYDDMVLVVDYTAKANEYIKDKDPEAEELQYLALGQRIVRSE